MPSLLAFVAGALGGFWALRTGDSPAPRVAIKEDRPASAPAALSAPSPVPSTSFPVSGRLLPPPSIVVQALPRLEQEPEKEAVTAAIDVKRPQLTPAAPSRRSATVPTTNECRTSRACGTYRRPRAVTGDAAVQPCCRPRQMFQPASPSPRLRRRQNQQPESLEPETPAAVVNRAVVTTDRRAAVRRTLQEIRRRVRRPRCDRGGRRLAIRRSPRTRSRLRDAQVAGPALRRMRHCRGRVERNCELSRHRGIRATSRALGALDVSTALDLQDAEVRNRLDD